MIAFPIPRITADRLARLPLACADESGPLGHVGIRITPTAVRFAATNGRMLASLLVPLDALTGDPGEIILDAGQFSSALKATAKAAGGRIQMEISSTEARLTNGTASAIVRRVEGGFPTFDHIWTRTAERSWIPTMSSLDGGLVAIAQKISGSRNPLLFSSPVDPSARLERIWGTGDFQTNESIALADLRAAVSAPAYWADHELAILIMPITRGNAERHLDLGAHVMTQLQLVDQAA